MTLGATINNQTIEIETLPRQNYGNIDIIPIKTEFTNNIDILNLHKGLELGIVEVSECEPSTVGEVLVKNNAVTPLILLDGDEIIGANQNRIVNSTILIAPKTTMKVSVSCTERGRWHYTNEFKNSQYLANSNTRRQKALSSFHGKDLQTVVWNSIDELESDIGVKSKTSAMSESYENLKDIHDSYLEHFPLENLQNGSIIAIDGEIKGIEIMHTPSLYKQYHEKILRSYIIDTNFKSEEYNEYALDEILDNISQTEFVEKENIGLGNSLKVITDYGVGSVLFYNEELVHFQYFKKPELKA